MSDRRVCVRVPVPVRACVLSWLEVQAKETGRTSRNSLVPGPSSRLAAQIN